MKHALLISEFLSTPWALMPERLSVAVGVVARWAHDVPRAMEDEDFTQRRSAWEIRKEAAARLGGGGIAVLPLYGTIVQRAGMMTEWSGGTSTQQFAAAFRDAMADNAVGGILIDVDSPGGSVYGVAELADEIYQARASKPIVAVANSLAASAAYWLAASASEFYATPGGEVGSIGVWSAHEDYSKYLEAQGVKTSLISAGKFKTEGNPYGPLDDEARAFMQSRVDDYYSMFTKAVARARNRPVGDVRDGMGQGRVLGAKQSQSAGMVDGVMTFDQALKRVGALMREKSGASTSRSASERDLEVLSL